MKLIVGLGNPGREYLKTRHNAGFRIVDALAAKLGASFDRTKFKGEYADAEIQPLAGKTEDEEIKLLIVKPQTYMNLSGETVISFAGFYKIEVPDILVACDDATLPVGAIRLRRGGSDGGQKGLRNITERLGTQQFARLRFGVGGREPNAASYPADLANHVLTKFSSEEEELLSKRIAEAAEACIVWARRGVEAAMNVYNVIEKKKTDESKEKKD